MVNLLFFDSNAGTYYAFSATGIIPGSASVSEFLGFDNGDTNGQVSAFSSGFWYLPTTSVIKGAAAYPS